jgi:electron transfer flavoprotein beta subunit
MNIAVVLRAVRDPASFTVHRRAEKIFIHREQFICNPADQNALEAALRMPGGMVTAMSYGGGPAEDVLRMARAMGAARAVLAADPNLQNADTGTLTGVLLAVLRQIEPANLVVLGDEVLDGDYAQVGPRLAQALGWPFVESAWAVERVDDGRLKAVVRRGNEYRSLAVELPAVVSVPRDSNRVRYAPAGRVITCFTQPEAIESLTPAALGLDNRSAPPVSVSTGEAYPPERQFGEVLDGALAETMTTLVAAVRTVKAGR